MEERKGPEVVGRYVNAMGEFYDVMSEGWMFWARRDDGFVSSAKRSEQAAKRAGERGDWIGHE